MHGISHAISSYLKSNWKQLTFNELDKSQLLGIEVVIVFTQGDFTGTGEYVTSDFELPPAYSPSSNLTARFMEVGEEFGRYHIAIENSRYWVVRHVYLALMIALIVLFGVLGGDQFIYFQF